VGQQRFLDDYRDALKLPLPLHLAELACEYALTYPGEAAHEKSDITENNDETA